MILPPLTLYLGPERVPMQFRHVPAGSFLMGQRGEYADEEPVHAVEIRQDFYLATFPVTQQQFGVWTGSAAHAAWLAGIGKSLDEKPHENGFPGNLRHPAEYVSWHLALGFAQWLADQPGAGVPEGFFPVLPTEAEWEYACRWRADAGHPTGQCTPQSCARTEYYNGDGEAALAEVGWYDGNSGNTTHDVDEKPEVHPLGLRGLHGNVWEWCADGWNDLAYRQQIDGSADPSSFFRNNEMSEQIPAAGVGHPLRVLRGGSWLFTAWYCRSAFRIGWRPGRRNWDRGFRLALVPGPGGGGQQQGSGATTSQQGATGDGGRGASPESEGAVNLAKSRLPNRPA